MTDQLTDSERKCYFDGAVNERERIRLILTCKEAKNQANLAQRLALDWDGSVDEARKLLDVLGDAKLADVMAARDVRWRKILQGTGANAPSTIAG